MAVPGANGQITTCEASKWMQVIRQSDVLLLKLEIPLEIDRYIMQHRMSDSSIIILDAGPSVECPREILAGADIVSPNETEAECITGIPINSVEAAIAAAERIISVGAKMC